jgi:hypothetical protein
MKSYSIVSAPVRYLAYAAVLAMTLSILLQIPEIQRGHNLPVACELCLHSHGKAATVSMPFPGKNPFAKDHPWKITTDTTLRFLQGKVDSMLSFSLPESPVKEFFGKQFLTQPIHTSGE